MPNRRAVLLGLGLTAVASAAAAHTPYGQWVVYRQKHLLIGSHRGDLRTYDLAKGIVADLEAELPEARARVARGPRPQRIAALVGTGQLLVTVLAADEAMRMAEAAPPFEGYLPTPLLTLGALPDGYLLFASPDLPADHAWMVVDALGHSGAVTQPIAGPIPLHPGAAAFWKGAPMPE